MSIHELTSFVSRPIWNVDADDGGCPDVVGGLAHATGTPPEIAHKTMLLAFEGRVFARHAVGSAPWVLRFDVGERRKRRAGLQACPQCLRRDGYFRRIWRLGFVTTCACHEVRLVDRCSRCSHPIRPWRSRYQTVPTIGTCVQCKMPLQEGDGASTRVVEFQARLARAALEGITPTGLSPLQLFDILRECCVFQLMKRMVRARAAPMIEFLEVSERHALLEHAAMSMPV